MEDRTVQRQATLTRRRLLPGLQTRFAAERDADPAAWDAFAARLEGHFGQLFACLLPLYGGRYDFYYQVERLLILAARSWLDWATFGTPIYIHP